MKYEIHVGSADHIGMGMINGIIEVAAMGGRLKEGTIPYMRFPYMTVMVVESETPPTPTPSMRVFEADTRKEVHAVLLQAKESEFSMDLDDDSPKVKLDLNGDRPWTKEELEAMDFDNEFKPVMAASGISGKKRVLMMNKYLSKYSGNEVVDSESEEESE